MALDKLKKYETIIISPILQAFYATTNDKFTIYLVINISYIFLAESTVNFLHIFYGLYTIAGDIQQRVKRLMCPVFPWHSIRYQFTNRQFFTHLLKILYIGETSAICETINVSRFSMAFYRTLVYKLSTFHTFSKDSIHR